MAKKPKFKALPGNEDLLVAFKIRSRKSKPHSLVVYVRSAIQHSGSMRLVIYVQGRKFLKRLRLDNKDVSTEDAFVKLASEVDSCNSYDSLLTVLKANGFPEIQEGSNAQHT